VGTWVNNTKKSIEVKMRSTNLNSPGKYVPNDGITLLIGSHQNAGPYKRNGKRRIKIKRWEIKAKICSI